MADALVDVAGVGKSYAGRSVVRDVTLRLVPGEIVGLVGANGGGKTTTLRILAGLVRPDAGSGHVLGHALTDASVARRARTGYMPQRLSLHPDLSVRENLRFRAAIHTIGDARQTIADAVAEWGLAPVLDTRFAHVSGGWGRRVQFAATMLHAPPLLLLDEPTAGLDVVTRNRIWSGITELAARGHGVVVSTHDLAEAARCPAILHYHDGVAEGPITPDDLVARSGAATLEGAVATLAAVP